jgi:hypothetical protein
MVHLREVTIHCKVSLQPFVVDAISKCPGINTLDVANITIPHEAIEFFLIIWSRVSVLIIQDITLEQGSFTYKLPGGFQNLEELTVKGRNLGIEEYLTQLEDRTDSSDGKNERLGFFMSIE